MSDSIKIWISNCRGTDFDEDMWTVAVGEATRRFTAEQVDEWRPVEQFVEYCLRLTSTGIAE